MLVGTTGLIGMEMLQYLLAAKEYSKIISITRQSSGIKHEKLEERIIDFDMLSRHDFSQFRINDVFCCLGTTIKKAKSKEAFIKVDLEYPLTIAKLAKEVNAEKFILVSSMGANARSKLFYSKVKGQLEEQLQQLNFHSLIIFRPSLLLGKRAEFRPGETMAAVVAKGLFFLFIGHLKKYEPIAAKKVAQGMYKAAQLNNSESIKIYESSDIVKIAKEAVINNY
ncbi:MAG: NAD-dependent epimerase/dehydratase family protein [Bacillota bacterium]|nr:NAD-dependent epimerase/dehydratase family protein [Bacillota bacterium]